MKRVASLAAVFLLVATACKEAPSKLDGLQGKTGAAAEKAPVEADHSGSVEDRLARLESFDAKNAEALDFLAKVYANQKAQQQQKADEEPAPDAVFAVDIAQDIANGQVEGPQGALVTIVEAWDFA